MLHRTAPDGESKTQNLEDFVEKFARLLKQYPLRWKKIEQIVRVWTVQKQQNQTGQKTKFWANKQNGKAIFV